ncbi:MAG: GSU2403 family nucleotidyltransferase fold protein [Rhabdochlamydiaceae bacterium]|nr:GSU2403 family nucleotidyltransferase fold protein [Candidatus Amphrikana amoebophyrae]
MENEDKIVSEFLKSLGDWSNYVIIGGGYALIIYKLYLADPNLDNSPVGTRDIDSLLPRSVPPVSEKNIAHHLLDSNFKPVFKDYDLPATEAYIREINGVEVEVEFLTDSAVRKDKDKNVQISGVVAQPLSYLTMSLEMTMEFHTRLGLRGGCGFSWSLDVS